MKIVDTLAIAKDNFKSNKLRTVLTVSGVIIGIGSILFLVSLGYGLQKITIEQISTTEALRILEVSAGGSKILSLNKQVVEDFSSIPGVEGISPRLDFSAQANFDSTATETIVSGIAPEFQELEVGLVDKGENLGADNNQIIITTTLMELLGVTSFDEIVGEEIDFDIFVPNGLDDEEFTKSQKTFSVIGVREDKTNNSQVNLAALEDLGVANYGGVKVKVISQEKLDEVRSNIESRGYTVNAPVDTLSEINVIFQIFQVILGVFGVIALCVAAIGMFNTMTISLLERTREIGIMKAIGANNRDIMKIFLLESILIGFIGGILGILVGWLFGQGINIIVNALAKTLGGEPVQIFVTPWEIAVVMIVLSIIIGLLTGLYPARRGSRLNPLLALRYE